MEQKERGGKFYARDATASNESFIRGTPTDFGARDKPFAWRIYEGARDRRKKEGARGWDAEGGIRRDEEGGARVRAAGYLNDYLGPLYAAGRWTR